MTTARRENPYPGLRPFRADETHLFFGRDEQRSELLGRLRRSRFLAVVGTSGSGKSSLVRAGLLPGLYGGFMADSGGQWRIADLRPGGDPIGNLARALDKKGTLRDTDRGEGELSFAEAILRRSAMGLTEAVRRAGLAENARLLVLVDQFEELFRSMATADTPEANNDASAFIKLLLEAKRQTEVPIYVVLTMRSDFLGDCARFRDLPEAINDGQYLIPRMTRDQRREAIEGPAAVCGASLSPTLVNRLLNDVGDDPDHLPILQHALMRTWDHWKETDPDTNVVGLKDYEDQEVGGMARALSLHADSVLAGLAQDEDEEESKKRQRIAEYLFKCLTEKIAGDQQIRRLATLQEIADVAGANSDEVISVIDAFRHPSNSFLMPPIGEELRPETYVDISHESLIRNWGTLKRWVDNENRSALIYQRLAQSAILHREGKESLLGEQALRVALEWEAEQQPTRAWAKRYDPAFDAAIEFLADSELKFREIKEEQSRTRKVRRTLGVCGLLSLLMVAFVSYFNVRTKFERTEQEVQRRTADTLAYARDREILSALYALHKAPADLEELDAIEKEALRRDKFVSLVHFEVASKMADSKGLSPEDELLASLYHALEYRRLEDAKEKLQKLKDNHLDTSHFAAATRQWGKWGEIQARRAKQETRDRELLSTLYAKYERREEDLSKFKDAISKLRRQGELNEEEFANRLHFRLASKMANSEVLGPEAELLVSFYHALESEGLKDVQKKIDSLNKEFPDSTHALVARSAARSHNERNDQPLLDRALYSADCPAWLGSQDYDYIFGNPIHEKIANRVCSAEDTQLEQLRSALRQTETRRARESFDGLPQDYLLATVYSMADFDTESARAALAELETRHPYAIHTLLADAAVQAAEPPFTDLVETSVQWIRQSWNEFWPFIALLVIWPLWIAWDWIRRRLWKGAQIKAKPNIIPRALAVVADYFIAYALGIFVVFFPAAIVLLIVARVTGTYVSTLVESLFDEIWFTAPLGVLWIATFSAYLLFRDAIKYRFHRSIGKILFKLRPIVVANGSGSVTMRVSAKRNWLPLVLLAGLLVAAIFTGELADDSVSWRIVTTLDVVVSSLILVELVLAAIKEGRTLHDRFGGTRVIDIRSEEAVAISSPRQRSAYREGRPDSYGEGDHHDRRQLGDAAPRI